MVTQNLEKDLKKRCSECSLREICLPLGLNTEELQRLEEVVKIRRRVNAGQHLFRTKDHFQTLTVVRSGFFKVYEMSAEGQEQITAFPMEGELMGLDAIGTGAHRGSAVALENSDVCDIPFATLEGLLVHLPRLQHQFHRLLSGEIANNHNLMAVLGTRNAEHKVAAFLLDLSERLEARGHSPLTIRLPMSREDIGNYLGLKLETVSRMFSKFRDDGLIVTEGRKVFIRDLKALSLL